MHQRLHNIDPAEYQNLKPRQSNFDFTKINIPTIPDLELALHQKPFATGLQLAHELHRIQTTRMTNPNTNQRLEKKLALKSTNEKQLKNDVTQL